MMNQDSQARHGVVFGQLGIPAQCCAEAPADARAPQLAKYLPELGSDDIMSLGIESFATEGSGTKNLFRVFTVDCRIHEFQIHHGFWHQDPGTRILVPKKRGA